MTLDLSKMTYRQMANLVEGIGVEIKHRNPIGVNLYMQPLRVAWAAVSEIADGEASNFTSECGPKEPKCPSKRKSSSSLRTARAAARRSKSLGT